MNRARANAAAISTLAATTLPQIKQAWYLLKRANREFLALTSVVRNTKTVLSPALLSGTGYRSNDLSNYLSPRVRGRSNNKKMPRKAYRKRASKKRSYKPKGAAAVGSSFKRDNIDSRITRRSKVTYNKKLTTSAYNKLNTLLGPPPNFDTQVKRFDLEQAEWSACTRNALYGKACIKCPYSADSFTACKRTGNSIVVKGVNIKVNFKLKTQYLFEPLLLRWAIIANLEDQTGTTSGTDVPTANFFQHIEPVSDAEGGADFTQDDSICKMEMREINPRKWLVVKQGRQIMQRNNTAANDLALGGCTQLDKFCQVDEYVPVNTQMRFHSTLDDFPADKNIWFAYWGTTLDKAESNVDVNGAFDVQYVIITYFKDVRH